jgi:hypothetical protein
MLGHDNGGGIWNVRVEREWCEGGVSPNSSLQNPFALPKGPESLARIAANMGIEIQGAVARMKQLCMDTDDDVVATTSFVFVASAGDTSTSASEEQAGSVDGGSAESGGGGGCGGGSGAGIAAPTSEDAPRVKVKIVATDAAKFDPTGLPIDAIVDRCTKLEITVTEPGTIGMR